MTTEEGGGTSTYDRASGVSQILVLVAQQLTNAARCS